MTDRPRTVAPPAGDRFATPPGIGFARLFDYPARFFPQKTALIDSEGEASFAELDRMAKRLATALGRAGARPGDRVALILPNCIPFIVAEMAIAFGGMVKVPLNIRFHVEEVLYALADCEPAVLICTSGHAREHRDRLRAVGSLRAVIAVGEEVDGCLPWRDAVAGTAAFQPVSHAADDPFLIRYTGGTTGRAKGIVHTAESFLAIHLDVLHEFGFRAGEVALHLGHLSHGINFMWAALYAVGATQILHERFEPKAVLAEIERRRVTYTYMVPTMIHRLLREDDGSADVSSLRSFLYASAPMPVPLLRQAIARFGNIFTQVYTLSESPVVTTMMRPHEHLDIETSAGNRLASCGREVLTMEVRLLADDGTEAPKGAVDGAVGEIAVRSRNNMACYWRLPEQTAETLVDGWVRTGDMARRDDEGYLYIVDRKKDMIITGALNVYPKEVEDALHAHPAVAQAAVIGVPDEEWGEAIKAYVVLHPGASATAEALIEHCRSHLASYKKPRQLAFVDALPLSPVGKVSRAALRERERRARLEGTGAADA